MKKLFACALILTTLSSIGTACFASALDTSITTKSIYRACGLQGRDYFEVFITNLQRRIGGNQMVFVSRYINTNSANIQELFDAAWGSDGSAQYAQAVATLQWFTHPGRQNVGLDCPYASELIQHIIDAVDIIHQQNPLY